MHVNLTHQIIAAAYGVHNTLGPGFLEKVYENVLFIELLNRRISVVQQVSVPVFYQQVQVDDYMADMHVEETVLIELKAVEILHPKHEAQLVNYLTATELDIGLLINFGSRVTIRRKYRTYRK
ncbi:GxxExxY protein [Spirosoma daeguense]